MNAAFAYVPSEGKQTAREIGKAMGVSCRVAVPLLNELLAEGLVERKNFRDDRPCRWPRRLEAIVNAPTLAWQRAVEKEISAAPTINPAALIVFQGEALRRLERARKHNVGTRGKSPAIQQLCEAELLDAIADVEEFDALTLEAI